jgi:hypothetical protein
MKGSELYPVDLHAPSCLCCERYKSRSWCESTVLLSDSSLYNFEKLPIPTQPLRTQSDSVSYLYRRLIRSSASLHHSLTQYPRHHLIKMPAATHAYYPSYSHSSYPIQVPQKPGYYYPPQHSYGRVSASPPEAPESVTTSGVASYEPSAASSNYAGSANEYESTSGAASVDLLDFMGNRMNGSFDPMPLDRSLAKQAQT